MLKVELLILVLLMVILEVLISDSKFINNSASYGGAIVNVKDLTVRNTEFVNNAPDTIFLIMLALEATLI